MDEYDVSKYSDAELLQILDLIGQPTDRELEMQILTYIERAQENAMTEEGKQLERFFIDVYNHFFIDDDVEHGDDDDDTSPNSCGGEEGAAEAGAPLKEGFDVPTPPTTRNKVMNFGEALASTTSAYNEFIPSQERVTTTAIGETQVVNYMAGRLNPILKQTIKRIISIDSQFRENKQLSSTNFTFNLSEPLKDVLSLKMYSIQIPTTWYNVNTNYGSNFIYLKGDTDGINNGNHDYKIKITPGNYIQTDTGTNKETDIVNAINLSIANLASTYLDVSFGETKMSFSSSNTKITFKIDLKKTYNQTNYYLEFPALTTTQTDAGRTSSLASYLGFNSRSYNCFCFYSVRDLPFYNSTELTNDDTISVYRIDSSNNKIQIIAYFENGGQSTEMANIPIVLSVNSYTRNGLFEELNLKLKMNPMLDSSYSNVERINIDSSLENGGYSYYKFNVKVNRTKIPYAENMKMRVVLPEFDLAQPPIWIGTTSCFHFSSIVNETNIVLAETPTQQTNYIIARLTQIRFRCTVPKYEGSGGKNDYVATIPLNINPGYILQDYIVAVNAAFQRENAASSISLNGDDLNTATSKTGMYFEQNRIYLNVDINRTFTNKHYSVSMNFANLGTEPFILPTAPLFANQKNETVIESSPIFITGYRFNPADNITFYPTGNAGNQDADPFVIHFAEYNADGTSKTYDFKTLPARINYCLKTYTDAEGTNPLAGCEVSYYIPENDTYHFVLVFTIKINKYFSQFDYDVEFYDISQNDVAQPENYWTNYLKFDGIYSIKTNQTQITTSNGVSTIKNNDTVKSNLIQLYDNSNNFFYLKSHSVDGLTGSLFESIKIKMDVVNGDYYSLDDVYKKINDQFQANPLTVGCYINNVAINADRYSNFSININATYTTKDFRLVFYDPYSFVQCYIGATHFKSQSIKNVSQDSTLGWLLGFRNYIVYYLKDYVGIAEGDGTTVLNYYSGNVCYLIADTVLNLSIYNYFMLVVNDYTSSHINDGLVTITSPDTTVSVPSHARIMCDPSTKNPYVSPSPGMTMKQLYSYNERLKARYIKQSNYATAPHSNDILGIIPMKISGMQNGSIYMEYGGQMQMQDRMYFGPVNIQRMTIELINDRGEIVDLNNNDWSFCLVCEQLYSNETNSSVGDARA